MFSGINNNKRQSNDITLLLACKVEKAGLLAGNFFPELAGRNRFEPESTFASFRFIQVQPHVLDGRRFFLTLAANQSGAFKGLNNIGIFFSAWAADLFLNVKRIFDALSDGQTNQTFLASGVVNVFRKADLLLVTVPQKVTACVHGDVAAAGQRFDNRLHRGSHQCGHLGPVEEW